MSKDGLLPAKPRSNVRAVADIHKVMKFVVVMATAMITLVVPGLILQRAGIANAGVVGLAGLAVVLATATLGWRVGVLTGGLVTAGVVLADAVAGSWVSATLLMVLASVLYGLSAKFGWQRGVSLAPIALAFVIAEPPSQAWAGDHPLLLIAVAAAATSAFGVLVTVVLSRGKSSLSPVPVSSRRAQGFAVMLGIAAAVTTPISVLAGWGHAGGWLIMTPLLVIQPALNDAVTKSMRRATGTVVGIVIAVGIGALIPEPWVLYFVGTVFAGLAMYAMDRRWDYSIFVSGMTVAVVLLEGTATSVTDTGRWRLIATLLGVGIAIAVTAVMSPFYVRANRRAGVTSNAPESGNGNV